MRNSIGLLFAIFMMASCGIPQGTSQQSLNGGTPSLTGLHSVVRIASNGVSYCSGVLVAADLVVTAAHCINADVTGDLTVVFPLAEGIKNRDVSDYKKLRDDSLLFFPNFDIAWIKLTAPAPAPYEPAQILGNTKDVAVGSSLNLVGTAKATPCDPADAVCNLVEVTTSLKSSWSSPHLVNLAVIDSTGPIQNSGTCPGDSGGPAFIEKDGLMLLYGIVAGKDPVFTSNADNTCGSPTSVMTRIGEYQMWIETTSSRELKVIEPATAVLDLDFLMGTTDADTVYSTWTDWFNQPKALDASWVTVHKILEQIVLEFQPQLSEDQIPLIFVNGGQDLLEKITELKSFSLGFPYQSVAITDLRPLASLKNLSDLTFIARSYQGLSVIGMLEKLKSLNIVGRVITKPEQGTLAWRDLASPSVETLRLTQLSALQMTEINWTHFPNMKNLIITAPSVGKIPTPWMHEERLANLQSLHVQELSCGKEEWPKLIMPNLKSLLIKSTLSLPEKELECINWNLLPGLTELSIQGYRINFATFTAQMPPGIAELLKVSR